LKDDFVPQNQPPARGESPEFHGHGYGYGPGHGKGHEHAPDHDDKGGRHT